MVSESKTRMQISLANGIYSTLSKKSENTGLSKSEIIQMAVIEWFEKHDLKVVAEYDKYNVVSVTDK